MSEPVMDPRTLGGVRALCRGGISDGLYAMCLNLRCSRVGKEIALPLEDLLKERGPTYRCQRLLPRCTVCEEDGRDPRQTSIAVSMLKRNRR